jgi:hypothetical protein
MYIPHGRCDLLLIREADGLPPLLSHPGEHREKDRGGDGDDGDHDEKLDQREPGRPGHPVTAL